MMRDISTEQPTHPDELLPWFVNGSLSIEERHEVTQHLDSCTRCQQEVALLQTIRGQIKETAIRSPGNVGLTRFLNEVRKEQTDMDTQSKLKTMGWKTGLAIAATFIILIQAGLLIDAWFLSKPVVPLAGPQVRSTILQITFNPAATEAAIRDLITGIRGTFIDGPSPLGIYRIELPDKQAEDSSLEHIIHDLRQHKAIIQHVAQE